MYFPGSRPTVSTPRSSVWGTRPMATISSSATTSGPSSIETTTSSSSLRCTAVAFASQRTSTPSARSASWTSLPAKRSSCSSGRSAPSISVTCAPSERQASAISTPTTPPPRIARRAGNLLRRRGLAVGPGARVGQAVDGRAVRAAAGGQDHGLAGHEHVVARAHAALAVQAPVGAHQRRRPCRPATRPGPSRRSRAPPRRGGPARQRCPGAPSTASATPGTRRVSS